MIRSKRPQTLSVESVHTIKWMRQTEKTSDLELGESDFIKPENKQSVATKVNCVGSSTITSHSTGELITITMLNSHAYTIKPGVREPVYYVEGLVRFISKDAEHFLQVIDVKGKAGKIELADYTVVSPLVIGKRQRPKKRSLTTTIPLGFRFDTAQHRYSTNVHDGTFTVLSTVIEFFRPTGMQKHADLSMIDTREEFITKFPLIAFAEPTGALTGNLIAVQNLVNEDPKLLIDIGDFKPIKFVQSELMIEQR